MYQKPEPTRQQPDARRPTDVGLQDFAAAMAARLPGRDVQVLDLALGAALADGLITESRTGQTVDTPDPRLRTSPRLFTRRGIAPWRLGGPTRKEAPICSPIR